jgi:glycyl-tRNA synthetase
LQADEIATSLMDSDMSTKVDKSTASLGRRYARVDEIGVPFAVTVDFQTLTDDTVTMRERDSMIQVRLHKKDVTPTVFDIVHSRLTWEQVKEKFPVVQVDDGEGGGVAASGDATTVSSPTVVVSNARGSFSRPNPN